MESKQDESDFDEECNLDYEDLNENITEMDEQAKVNCNYLSPPIDTTIKCLSNEEILNAFHVGMIENCQLPSD